MISEDFEDEDTLSLSLSLASPLLLAVRGVLRVRTTLGLARGGDCCWERVEGRGVDREGVALGGRGIDIVRRGILVERKGLIEKAGGRDRGRLRLSAKSRRKVSAEREFTEKNK